MKLNRLHRCLSVLLLCCLMLSGCQNSVEADTLELHMLYVDNADCFLIKQGNAAMLIDGGNSEDADRIVSYLHTHGVERLKAVVVSHPHLDHIGSLERVIEAYETDTVYYAAVPESVEPVTPMHTGIYDAIRRTGARLHEASDGALFSLGKAQVEMYPVTVSAEDANDYSLFVRVSFGNESILFTGDAKEKGQQALMDSGRDIAATILKVSHHGAKVSTMRAFLDKVDPKVALISCGVENKYGHPHIDTLTALEERDIICYRSDVHLNTILTLTQDGECFAEVTR